MLSLGNAIMQLSQSFKCLTNKYEQMTGVVTKENAKI